MSPHIRTPKQAGKAAVKQAAEYLILTNGETTTIEVINWLKQEGYIAYQADIARWMFKIAQEQNWEFRCNGRQRVYHFRIEEDMISEPIWHGFSLN